MSLRKIWVFLGENADIIGGVDATEVPIAYRRLTDTPGVEFFKKIPLLLQRDFAESLNWVGLWHWKLIQRMIMEGGLEEISPLPITRLRAEFVPPRNWMNWKGHC